MAQPVERGEGSHWIKVDYGGLNQFGVSRCVWAQTANYWVLPAFSDALSWRANWCRGFKSIYSDSLFIINIYFAEHLAVVGTASAARTEQTF